ncbi:PREDICTED: major urinary protein-like [Chinchilla lanigera]|uniref:Major urinary protein-like n=1 Tax=Chinchilla lanigera TaxID=34839 RepID=A0A8C2V0A1_CHILA|nr:PREDICTED: major urinary protein-like [Chinchilla lanigera]
MKLLLLSLGLGLACALQDPEEVPVQPGFRPEEVEGPWQTLKLGATDRSVIEEGGAYRCFMTSIRNLGNGNMNVTYFHRNEHGKCVEEFFIGEKTDTPGLYTFEYKGKNTLTFVAVGSDFTIMDFQNDNLDLAVVELQVRPPSLSVSPPGQEAYSKHLSRRGIGSDNTEDLTVQARCPSPGS